MPLSPRYKKKIWGLDDIIGFGKYRGTPIYMIIERDPSYINFLIEECGFEFDNETYREYEKSLSVEYDDFNYFN